MKTSVLIGLWATSTIVSSASIVRCDLNLESQYGSCERAVVTDCVSVLANVNQPDILKQCIIDGGCSEVDAASASETIIEQCGFAIADDTGRDLRKRQKNKPESSADSQPDDKTSAADAKTSAADNTKADTKADTNTPAASTDPPAAAATSDSPSNAAPSSAPAATTDTPSSTDSPSASATPASTPQTSAASTPSTAQTTSTPTGTGTSPLVCLTTSQKSTTWCLTTTNGAQTVSNCVPTFTPIVSCVPGLICQTQAAGLTTCMVRQDNLTTSGLIVTIFFATVVVIFAVGLASMCIKSRRTSRRQALQREAAMAAGSKARNMRDVEASNTFARGRMGGAGGGPFEDNQPLMAAQGPAGGNVRSRDPSADRRPVAHRVPSGSYQDIVAARAPPGAAPRLHPGMMDMDADEDDMGYRGPRGGR